MGKQPRRARSDRVREYYEEEGWRLRGEVSGEDVNFRRFGAPFRAYSEISTARVIRAFEGHGGRILFVGPGDMPGSHMALAARFESVVCLDISKAGLDLSRRRLGDAAEYLCGSVVDADLAPESFDAVFCSHVLYHIDRDQQETAVRRMIAAVRPGGRIIIVYANPLSPFRIPGRLLEWAVTLIRRRQSGPEPLRLYYHAFPLRWWRRFSNACRVELAPWEVVVGRFADVLLRPEAAARLFFRAAGWLETNQPGLAARLWHFPMIILDKPLTDRR